MRNKSFQKIGYRIAALAMTMAIAMSPLLSTAFAATDREVFDLQSLGVISGNENGDLQLEDAVTRAEFSKMVVNLLGYKDIVGSVKRETGFTDVAPDAWYAPYVGIAKETGYIKGFPDGTFRPEETIMMQDAVTVLVSALQYQAPAESNGGYPGGYLTTAVNIGLWKNLKADMRQAAKRGDIFTLLYNALDIELLKDLQAGGGTVEVDHGNTLRRMLSENKDLYHKRGVVTADFETWLISPNSQIGKGEIEIDGVRYLLGALDTSQYVGHEVEIYYLDDDSGSLTVKSIAFTGKNHVVEVQADDFINLSGMTVKYFDAALDRDNKLALSDDYVVVYNNRMLQRVTPADFDIENGRYRFIDNNGDRNYEYVLIEAEQSLVVDRVFEEGDIYFKNGYTLNGDRYLSLELDRPQTYRLSGASGEAIQIADVKKDDVVTVLQSKEKDYTKAIVSNQTAEGVLESTEEDRVTIDGTEYRLLDETVDVGCGDHVKAYLNYADEIVFMEEAGPGGTKKYGYLLQAGQQGMGGAELKILQAGNVTNKEEENLENLDDKNKIPVLYCRNESVGVYRLAASVRVTQNGITKQMGAGDFMNNPPVGPIIYTEKDGAVRSVEIPETVGGLPGREITYNAKERVFGSTDFGGFGIDGNTRVVCVPKGAAPSDEDCMVEVKIDNRDAAIKFDAQGYLIDEATNNVKFMVVHKEMDAASVSSTNYKTSKTGIVQKVGSVLNEAGDTTLYKIEILQSGGVQSYLTTELNEANAGLKTLVRGDLVYFELTNDGRLQNATVVANIEKDVNDYQIWNPTTEKEAVYGRVEALELQKIDVIKQRRIDEITLRLDGTAKLAEVPNRNAPAVYLFDRLAEEYAVTTTANIKEGSDSLYIWQPYGAPKVLVILR